MFKDILFRINDNIEAAKVSGFSQVDNLNSRLSSMLNNYYLDINIYYKNLINKNELRALKKVLKDDRLIR